MEGADTRTTRARASRLVPVVALGAMLARRGPMALLALAISGLTAAGVAALGLCLLYTSDAADEL